MSKYQIGQSVKLFTGLIGKIEEHTDYDSYKLDNSLEVWPGQIKCAAKIIELPEAPVYCKDCEHCIITPDGEDEDNIQLRFEGCPVSEWFERVWFVDSDFYVYGGYITKLETLQPPPNCYCFKKRESK